jgi:sugar lactone lactonase YvrE
MRRRASGATGGGANRLLASIRRTGIPVGVLVAGATLAAACGPRAEETEEAPAPDTAATAAGDTAAGAGGEGGGSGLGDPVLVVDSLAMPESAAPGPDGRWYVSLIGVFQTNGDGAIAAVDPASGAVDTVATGLDDPKGVAFRGDTLYVVDVGRVVSIAPGGAVSTYAAASAFPTPPQFLNDVVVDAGGDLLVSDTGSLDGSGGGKIFRVASGGDVSVLAGSDTIPDLGSVNGLASGPGGIYAVGFASGALYVLDGGGAWTKLKDGLGAGDGLALDSFGRLYVTDHTGGTVLRLANVGGSGNPFGPDTVATGIEGAADLSLDEDAGRLAVPALRGNRLLVFEAP